MVLVYNKTGEDVVQLHADEYGNGVVGGVQPTSSDVSHCEKMSIT